MAQGLGDDGDGDAGGDHDAGAGAGLMCGELLERDGFTNAVRAGGARDLGADVGAEDRLGRRVVLRCKRYATPLTSEAVQRFNGTVRPPARPVPGAAVPVVVALNGFTDPAAAFATRQRLNLVDRERLARWGAGQHLYDVLDIDRDPGRRTRSPERADERVAPPPCSGRYGYASLRGRVVRRAAIGRRVASADRCLVRRL
ncbi:restriction endonuclease [Kitasatospora sp. NPDC017646]|uniref:restriction endonuclease n=1 Tax=Kitasatospora sp. NPDC017646 TaxID=3364024 RepID=UPI0037A9A817